MSIVETEFTICYTTLKFTGLDQVTEEVINVHNLASRDY
jgi:hypothetical protein